MISEKNISLMLHWERSIRIEQIEYAGKTGHGIEVAGISHPPLHNDAAMFARWLKEYEEDLEDFPNFISFHGPIADVIPHSEDPAIRKIAAERIRKTMETAAFFGSDRVVFHTGINTGITDHNYYDRVIEIQAEFWKCMLSEFPDMTVCIENMWEHDHMLLSRIGHKCNDDRLKFCFDTGHFNIYGETSMREWFSGLGNDTCHFHLSDNPGGWDSHLRPGMGSFDWRSFEEIINERNIASQFVFELTDLKDQKMGIEWFMNLSAQKEIDPLINSLIIN